MNFRGMLVEKANLFLAHSPIINHDSAAIWESKGFDALFNKDVNAAITAFKNANKIRNGYHEAYEIWQYLDSHKNELVSGNSSAWKVAYATLGEKDSWKMSVAVKRKLEELSK